MLPSWSDEGGAGHVIGGRYRAVETWVRAEGLGRRARHTQLDVDMAVKVMSGELAGSTVAAERFKREARAAAMLRSPHVVQIHDYGVEDGQPYMVMELLAGEDLRAFIRRHGRVSLGRALQIVAPVCKALRVAHEAGIIHRDINPANVFLARSGGEEQVKVLDFGIAKAQHEAGAGSETTSRLVLGSPMYMSPEQARGAGIDARSDLWSLAVVAYELVVGRQPFRGATLGDVFARICGDEVPLPSAAGVCHPGLDDFFRRALARSPAARFPSAQALAEAFAALARDHASALDGDDDTERSPVIGGPAPASVSASSPVARGMPTPLSVVVPIEPSSPARRGRESDTLALAVAATAPERTQTEAPAAPRPPRRRAGALAGVVRSRCWSRCWWSSRLASVRRGELPGGRAGGEHGRNGGRRAACAADGLDRWRPRRRRRPRGRRPERRARAAAGTVREAHGDPATGGAPRGVARSASSAAAAPRRRAPRRQRRRPPRRRPSCAAIRSSACR